MLDARPNRIECQHCGEEIEEWMYTVRYGFWSTDDQNYERAPITNHICKPCYNERYDREAAAYTMMDSDRLWDVLEAADGELAADLIAFFVGGRPFVRVVDGRLQGARVKPVRRPGRVLKFVPDRLDDVDEEWFHETINRERRELPSDLPVLLKPSDETPFEHFDSRDHQLDEFTEDDG